MGFPKFEGESLREFVSFNRFILDGGHARIFLGLRGAEPALKLKQTPLESTVANDFDKPVRDLAAEKWSFMKAAFKRAYIEAALIAKGALGQKTRCGIFRKQGREIQVLDIAKQDYVTSAGAIADEVAAILKIKNPAEKFAALRASCATRARLRYLPRAICDCCS